MYSVPPALVLSDEFQTLSRSPHSDTKIYTHGRRPFHSEPFQSFHHFGYPLLQLPSRSMAARGRRTQLLFAQWSLKLLAFGDSYLLPLGVAKRDPFRSRE